jgi:hypothetical protein
MNGFVAMVRTGLVAGALLSLASACTPPWRQAYIRGEEAIVGARYDDAAVAFTESCEIDATASDACVRAKTLRKRAIESALSAAEQPCATDLSRCLQILKTARTLGVHERSLGKRIEGVLDDASARHVAACEAAGHTTWGQAMALGRCLGNHENDVGTTAHHRRVAAALQRLATSLEEGSDDDTATSVLRAGFVQCIAPTAERAGVLAQARAAIVARHQASLSISSLQGMPPEIARFICTSRGVTRAPVSCGPGLEGATLELTGVLETSRVTEQTSRTAKNIRYVDHIEERANPEHARLKDRVDTLSDDTRRAQAEAERADSACSAAETQLRYDSHCYNCDARTAKDAACDQDQLAERALRDAKSALDDAERELRNTDAILRIEHTALFDYIETRHTWQQPTRVLGTCQSRDATFQAPELVAERVVAFQDDTHVGFARAGLAEDPLVEPTGAMFQAGARDIASAELVSYAERCLMSFATDSRRCAGGFDCLQRRSLYEGDDPVVASLQAMAALVDKEDPTLPRLRCRT